MQANKDPLSAVQRLEQSVRHLAQLNRIHAELRSRPRTPEGEKLLALNEDLREIAETEIQRRRVEAAREADPPPPSPPG